MGDIKTFSGSFLCTSEVRSEKARATKIQKTPVLLKQEDVISNNIAQVDKDETKTICQFSYLVAQ
jgi:hypothetical protein